jgi:hypothetical protein
MSRVFRLLLGLLGFVFGVVAAIAVELVILGAVGWLFHSVMMPRGLGWIVGPLAAGVAGFNIFYNFDRLNPAITTFLNRMRSDKAVRVWLALSAVWVLSSATFFWLFDPFELQNRYRSYYWSSVPFLKEAFVILGPVVAYAIGIPLFKWANVRKD